MVLKMNTSTLEYLKRLDAGFLQEIMLLPPRVFEPVLEEIKNNIDAIAIYDKKWYQKYDRLTFLKKHEPINTFYLAFDLLESFKLYFKGYIINNKVEG